MKRKAARMVLLLVLATAPAFLNGCILTDLLGGAGGAGGIGALLGGGGAGGLGGQQPAPGQLQAPVGPTNIPGARPNTPVVPGLGT